MTSYHGMYRSNEVQADTDGVEELLDELEPAREFESEEDRQPKYNLDGDVHVDHDEGTVWFGSTATTFSVWDPGYMEERNEEFLERLAEHVEEPLIIRSVGYTKLRHVPDAWQWVVRPDGTVENESLSDASQIDT